MEKLLLKIYFFKSSLILSANTLRNTFKSNVRQDIVNNKKFFFMKKLKKFKIIAVFGNLEFHFGAEIISTILSYEEEVLSP